MKKRLRLGLEQLEARETPDVSLGRSAALAVPLPGQTGINSPQQLAFLPVSGQVQQLPVALPFSGVDQAADFSPSAFHAQILESLFRDSKELDRLFGQSLESPPSATDAASSAGAADVSDFSGLEAATLGLKVITPANRSGMRN